MKTRDIAPAAAFLALVFITHEETLEQFGLQAQRAVFPRLLARGDKQKVCLASVVAMHPRVLLLDEPTTGQDARDARQVMELAQELNRQGITILLVTHDLANVARYARRVIAINNSVILADGPTREVLADEATLAACHLAPPQITRLSLALASQGIAPALTPEALAAEIDAATSLIVEREGVCG
jgi:energy-coupling factor transport system ATP-binding protein